MKRTLFLSGWFLVLSCNNEIAGNSRDYVQEQWPVPDSLELIHYPDPSNQKLYKRMFVRDSSIVAAMFSNLRGRTMAQTACTHHSKFYLFSKGEVFKTVYVSGSCNYLAYAVNSAPRFVQLEPRNKKVVDSLVRMVRDMQ